MRLCPSKGDEERAWRKNSVRKGTHHVLFLKGSKLHGGKHKYQGQNTFLDWRSRDVFTANPHIVTSHQQTLGVDGVRDDRPVSGSRYCIAHTHHVQQAYRSTKDRDDSWHGESIPMKQHLISLADTKTRTGKRMNPGRGAEGELLGAMGAMGWTATASCCPHSRGGASLP